MRSAKLASSLLSRFTFFRKLRHACPSKTNEIFADAHVEEVKQEDDFEVQGILCIALPF
jgi:hypothetical protein